jgi:hypothetical protein
VPPESVTAATVWLLAPRSRVPPLTVKAPAVAPRVPLPLISNVPAVTVVPPV